MKSKFYYATDDFHQHNEPIGILWLIKTTNIQPIQPIYLSSSIGSRNATYNQDGFVHKVYQKSTKPDDTIVAHLQFHLRHEIIHFEFLARLFDYLDKQLIQDWINSESTGQYARRCAFLYEFLTDNKLLPPNNIGGNYIDVLDEKTLVTANKQHSTKNKRWRVNNNIAGTKDFAPMVVKNDDFDNAIELDIKSLLNQLSDEFGENLLIRASVWITLGESKASFTIEGESKQAKRIERFADFMARNIGNSDNPLSEENLAEYQQELLGKTIIQKFGVRQSPVFIGESRLGYDEVIHYIAPPFEQVSAQLEGLRYFMDKTVGQSAIMRSAVIAFAFVYIHPLADGNGRLHRFLFNDILRRDGVMSEPVILPISKAIIANSTSLQAYANILDSISKPLMQRLQGQYCFAKERKQYDDGIFSNLQFNGVDEANYVWRFLDLTPHVLYLSKIIEQVIYHDIKNESDYLRQYDLAREQIKEIIDMPNDYIDRIIRSIQQSGGKRSNKLVKEVPILADDELYNNLVAIVKDIFLQK